jgi:hypothetical protein
LVWGSARGAAKCGGGHLATPSVLC